MILIGGMIPTAIFLPTFNSPLNTISLNTSWQISAVLICTIVCGSRSAFVAIVAYLIIGLFYLPIFNGGGSIGYILTPEFGYLLGFLPASIICGELAQKVKDNRIITITLISCIGVIIIHLIGIANIILGTIVYKWPNTLGDILFSYTLAPISNQIILCPVIAILSISLKKILLIK